MTLRIGGNTIFRDGDNSGVLIRPLPDTARVRLARGREAGTRPTAHLEDGLSTVSDRPPEHSAERPSWDCRICGRPWPCDPAREAMVAEMDRVSLAIFMWINLEDAVGDLPSAPAMELFDRFIGWTYRSVNG
jgi:hypothetical protein